MSVESKSKMKVSIFVNRLLEKFDVTSHEIKIYVDSPSKIDVRKTTDPFINECVLYIKNKLLNKELMLLICDKYNIDFYIEKLHSVISKSVKKLYGIKNLYLEKKAKFFEEEFGLENVELKKLKIAAINHLCETDFIPNYFSKVMKIETVEDYIPIDKMVCDFHNIIRTVLNIKSVKDNSLFDCKPYYEPVYNDDCNYKLVEGFKIKIEKGLKLKQINGLNKKEEALKLKRDKDYVVDQFKSLNFVGKVLEMKNIHEIEVILREGRGDFVVKRFKIKDLYESNGWNTNLLKINYV